MDESESFICCYACQKNYDSPRFLPCGETLCQKCIETNTNQNGLKCPFCHKIHSIPSTGYPINKQIVRIKQKFDEFLYRGSVYQSFKNNLNEFETLIDYFKMDIYSSKSKIYGYCSELINKIDLTVELKLHKTTEEVKHLDIQNNRDSLIDKIIKYQTDCINNLETNEDSNEEIYLLLFEWKTLITKEKQNLEKINFDENVLIEKNNVVKNEIIKFNHVMKTIEMKILNKMRVVFVKQDSNETLGKLKQVKLDQIGINDFEKIDVRKSVENLLFFRMNLEIMDNGFIVIEYVDRKINFSFEIFDLEMKKNSSYSFPLTGIIYTTLLRAYRNKILFHVYGTTSRKIGYIDLKLKKLKEAHCPYELKSMIGSKENIVGLVNGANKIAIFDWNLNELMLVQSNSSIFHFNGVVLDMFRNDDFIILKGHNWTSLHANNGRLVKKINLPFFHELIGVHSNMLIGKNSRDPSKIYFYDLFNGKIIESKNINGFDLNKLKLLIMKDFNFNFIDRQQGVVYRQYY